MPRMDGLSMLKKLREDEWGKTTQVIVLTNLNGSEQVARAMEIGWDASNIFEYLIKTDVKVDEIVKKIKEKLKM